jgi:hypothetical protein
MCYIDAMMLKGLATFALLVAIVQAPASAPSQASSHPASGQRTSDPSTYAAQSQSRPDCNGVPCEDQQPRVIVTLPAPAPAAWPWHDRILWAAYLVLAIVGYAGIMLAVSTLKKIERHTSALEAAAAAAADTAQAALLHAQGIINAERPWLLIGVEPSPGIENSFKITATNRGRSPATITSALDQVIFAVDEAHLPAFPPFKAADSAAPFVPVILLPGEFFTVKTIKREDAKALCASDEKFKQIENWDERIFLCGKVRYSDLVTTAGKPTHESNWCCWYIHGRQRSGLAIAGPPEYHLHT